jgi:hypothetical protein
MSEMPDKESKPLRETLLVPIVVGLVVAFFAFILPKLFEREKQLSYSVEGPTPYINQQLQGVTLLVNGKPAPSLFITRVRLWNSGGISLTNLPVLLVFSSQGQSQLLSLTHQTTPPYQFGKIDDQTPDNRSKRFIYELLNPRDQDSVTLLTDQPTETTLYAKAEGLTTQLVAQNERTGWRRYAEWVAPVVLGLVSVFAALLSIAIKSLGESLHILGVFGKSRKD